jgi:hypothetical protein
MVTSAQALKKYGDPNLLETQSKHFELWIVESDILEAFKHTRFSALGTIGFPKKIFVNKDMLNPLRNALRTLICRGVASELKTWDGVFVIRSKRALASLSLHSWAIAVDVNQAENQLNMVPKLSPEFVKCFTDCGFDWGGIWKRKDGMHFQLAKI